MRLFDVVRLEPELKSQLKVELNVVMKGSLKSRIGELVADNLVEVYWKIDRRRKA